MSVFRLFCLLSVLCVVSVVPAHAQHKPITKLFWWESHWKNQDFKPYLEDSRISHSYRYRNDDWHPRLWEASIPGGREHILDELKRADIIDHFSDNEDNTFFKNRAPRLCVGEGFYRLSSLDKRRVVRFVDYHYGVTSDLETPFLSIHDKYSRKQIGIYSTNGLQLQ